MKYAIRMYKYTVLPRCESDKEETYIERHEQRMRKKETDRCRDRKGKRGILKDTERHCERLRVNKRKRDTNKD